MAGRKGEIRTQVDVQGDRVVFIFGKGTGEDWQALDSADFDYSKLPEDMQRQMGLYGLRKALMDRTSEYSTPMQDAGDPRVKIDAMQDLWEGLFLRGQWKAERKGSGGGGVPLVVEAIAEHKDVSVAQAQKAWKQQTDEQKETIKENPEIAAIMRRLQDERAQEDEVDLSDLA